MTLRIDPQCSLNEISERFSHCYPSVRMEFAFKGNERLNHSKLSGKPFTYVRIADLLPESKQDNLTIEEDMTIAEVESLFWKHFGLPVQLYVQQGGYWLKTALYNAIRLAETGNQ